MGGFSWIHWVVVLVVVILIFGTKKLRNLGGDIGAAIRNFKTSVKEESEAKTEQTSPPPADDKQIPGSGLVIDAEASTRDKSKS